jgi:hypothetical protein
VIRVQLVPQFVSQPILGLPELKKKLERIRTWREQGSYFELFPSGRDRSVQDAIIRYAETNILEVAEFNECGLLSFTYNDILDARRVLYEPPSSAVSIEYLGVLSNVLAMMCLGVLTYEAMGFHGLCKFTLEIRGVRGRTLATSLGTFGEPCPDEMVRFSVRVTPSELRNGLLEWFTECGGKVLSAFGREINSDDREQFARMVNESRVRNFETQYS